MFRMNYGEGPTTSNEEVLENALNAKIEDTESSLEFQGDGFELIPDMINLRREIFLKTSDPIALTEKIQDFLEQYSLYDFLKTLQ